MGTTIKHKRATAERWAELDPVLSDGELGLDRTNRILKVGDGVTAWSELAGIPLASLATLADLADLVADDDPRLSDARPPAEHGNEAHADPFLVAADLDGLATEGYVDDAIEAQAGSYVASGPAPSGGDDTVAIQAALDAAADAGGGVVRLRAGEYLVSESLTLDDNVTITGEGREATTVRSLAGVDGPVITNADHDAGNTGCGVRNLHADGNKSEQTVAFSCVWLVRSTGCIVTGVKVSNAKRTGSYPDVSARGEGVELLHSHRNTLSDIVAVDCDYDGVKLRTSNYNTIAGVLAINCGKSAVQLAYDRDLDGDDGMTENGSCGNTLTGVTHVHSTGTPSAQSPQTVAMTLHCASYNAISNVCSHGTQGAISSQAGSLLGNVGNVVEGGSFHVRGDSNPFLTIRGWNNQLAGLHVRLMAGTGGSGGSLFKVFGKRNEVRTCTFSAGEGTWDGSIESGATDCAVLLCRPPEAAYFAGWTDDGTGSLIVDPDLDASYLGYIGSPAEPISDPNHPRTGGLGPKLWYMDAGITPANAVNGDIIWNADA